MSQQSYRDWVYSELGDYHRNLDPNWSYTPTYLRKMAHVRKFINQLPQSNRILDIGCGEGLLVEHFRQMGRDIEGLDQNYESEYVRRGDVINLPYADTSADVILLLDVFEHLSFQHQPLALSEIHRVLKPNGLLLMSIPNLAHLNSRINFLFRGRLDRTDIETNHIGERPLYEYQEQLRNANFLINKRVGITLTLPIVYRRLICRWPARLRWLHDLQEPVASVMPLFAMIVLISCNKR